MREPGTTPPHHPTYGVRMSEDAVKAIMQICLPGPVERWSISMLPHGKSFNNRIYFIGDERNPQHSYVLKVNGRLWGSSKIENEVSCLLLLQRYCPALPVPRVVAWSRDGASVTVHAEQERSVDSQTYSLAAFSQHGWVLMTRLRGDPIQPQALSLDDLSNLSKQLADMIISWRRLIPKSPWCGNLLFHRQGGEFSVGNPYLHHTEHGLNFDINGILVVAGSTGVSISTLLSYWRTKLSCAIRKLATEEVYTANRNALLEPSKEFVETTLSSLSLFRNNSEKEGLFIFSHTDLSPRNVLVSGLPPKVSGIVDFEFAGFFPSLEDFTGVSIISNQDDPEGWPKGMYDEILRNMELAGDVTPLSLSESIEWEELMSLVRLETYIAPWWLEEEDSDAPEVREQLEEATMVVKETVRKLRSKLK